MVIQKARLDKCQNIEYAQGIYSNHIEAKIGKQKMESREIV